MDTELFSMCGIAGEVSFAGIGVSVVGRMTAALAHRGPDDEGLWGDGTCVLGHRRLAIIDLSEAGRQPMGSEDSSKQLVFNGEIYNYRELRRELESKGHLFRTRTDSEVLLRSYEEWGVGCLTRLRGMFAFGIWDRRSRELFLARDRTGKKPLFYSGDGHGFRFASELQGLFAGGGIRKSLNRGAIDQYLGYGYVPAPQTIFEGVFKLPPAHYLVLGESGLRIERYWELAFAPKTEIGEDEAAEELRERLTEAVRCRLVSDVPLGAFLSGGIDSSIIVGLMAKLTDRPVKTFSIGFREGDYNELGHARRVAARWQTEHHEFIVEPNALEILPRLVRHFGEPYADASAVPTYYVAEMTRSEVTVALNGDGGDESFAGYERYRANRLAELIHRLPGGATQACLLGRLLPDVVKPGSRWRQLRRFLLVASMRRSARYPRWVTYFTREQKREFFTDGVYVEGQSDLVAELMEAAGRRGLDAVDSGMAVDIESYLPYDLLVKVDITTMANGLEARSPFLDQEVMEFAARLPSSMKLKGRQSKYLLKKAFADLLPVENLRRAKMGFGLPVGEWFRGPMRELLMDTLVGARSGFYRPGVIERLMGEHLARRADHSFLLWNLLMLELWYRQVYCGAGVANSQNH